MIDLSAARDIEDDTLVILADEPNLRAFAASLASAGRISSVYALRPHEVAASTYEPLTTMSFVEGEGPLVVRFYDGAAEISGGQREHRAFAGFLLEFIEENDMSEPGMHAHWPWEPWSAQGTGSSIIVAGRVPG